MPEISPAQRMQGGFSPPRRRKVALLWDDWPPVPAPDQSKYGTATTDPLGREGPGWTKGKHGLPVRVKGETQ